MGRLIEIRPTFKVTSRELKKIQVLEKMSDRARDLALQKRGKLDGQILETPKEILTCDTISVGDLRRARNRGIYYAEKILAGELLE
jgi:hypothetical protein